MASPYAYATPTDGSRQTLPAACRHCACEHDRSCQDGQSLVEELCHNLKQHELQIKNAQQVLITPPPPPSGSSLPPPQQSLFPTPESFQGPALSASDLQLSWETGI